MTDSQNEQCDKELRDGLATEHFSYGHVYLDQDDSERAREEFTLAAELSPDNSTVLIGLGRSLLACGRTGEALPILEKAVSINAHYADGHFHLAQVYLENDERDKAIDHFKEALNINPRYNAASAVLSRLLQDRNHDIPEPDAGKMEHDKLSRQANTHFHLGTALLQKNLLQEALAELKQAIALCPHYPDFHNRLGELYRKRELYHLAEEEFRLALKLNPRYMAATLNLAKALQNHATVLSQQAADTFRLTLELDAGNAQAQAALEALCPHVESSESRT
jgi:tetratricopeptide (TPR) repeat protein